MPTSDRCDPFAPYSLMCPHRATQGQPRLDKNHHLIPPTHQCADWTQLSVDPQPLSQWSLASNETRGHRAPRVPSTDATEQYQIDRRPK